MATAGEFSSKVETLLLAAGLLDAIVAHARSGYPEEVCGLIAGPPGSGLELHRGRNLAPDPRSHFLLDPATLALQVEFGDRGWSLAAIYHSHPYGPDVPSAEDIAQAFYPESIYIICNLAACSLVDPHAPVVRGFSIRNGDVSEVRLLQTLDTGATIEYT